MNLTFYHALCDTSTERRKYTFSAHTRHRGNVYSGSRQLPLHLLHWSCSQRLSLPSASLPAPLSLDACLSSSPTVPDQPFSGIIDGSFTLTTFPTLAHASKLLVPSSLYSIVDLCHPLLFFWLCPLHETPLEAALVQREASNSASHHAHGRKNIQPSTVYTRLRRLTFNPHDPLHAPTAWHRSLGLSDAEDRSPVLHKSLSFVDHPCEGMTRPDFVNFLFKILRSNAWQSLPALWQCIFVLSNVLPTKYFFRVTGASPHRSQRFDDPQIFLACGLAFSSAFCRPFGLLLRHPGLSYFAHLGYWTISVHNSSVYRGRFRCLILRRHVFIAL